MYGEHGRDSRPDLGGAVCVRLSPERHWSLRVKIV